MQHSSRATNGRTTGNMNGSAKSNGNANGSSNGNGSGPQRAQMMAASHAPVAEPAGVSSGQASSRPAPALAPAAEPYANPVPVPLSAAEAEQVARHKQAERSRNTSPEATEAAPAIAIPQLPPVPKAPARLAPVILVLVQTLLDIVAIGAGFGVAFLAKFSPASPQVDLPTYLTMLTVTVATIIVTFYFSKLYSLKRGASRVDEFYKIAAAVSMGTFLSLATNSLILGEGFTVSRQVVLTGWVLTVIFVGVLRLAYGVLLGELRKHNVDVSRVLIVGTGPTAQVVEARLRHHRTLGYSVVGMVDSSNIEGGADGNKVRLPVVGTLPRLAQLVRKHKVDEVIVALTGASDRQLKDVLDLLQDETVSIKIYPDAFQLMTQNEVSVGELSGLPLLNVKDVALRGWNRRFKRAFDIAFSLLVLVLTAPLMLAIAVAIKLSSPGPVFFIQERVGLDGKPFQLVKFRTMKVNAEVEMPKEGMPGWTVRNDPRRTRIGTFLRRFSLDELPQFYNVLVGEMSVVGPRPEQPAYVQEFAQRIPSYLRRHREKAGITGWAQVNGLRGDSSIETRTAADLYYVENWSVLFDLKIIVRTVLAMVRGKNAY